MRLYATQPDGTHLSASAGTTVIEGLDGGWHNYALVVTSNNIKLYRNAQEIFSVSGAIELIGRYLYIAGNPASQANRQFNISDIVAYNYAIPATTTNGIPGVIERYNSGEFLTAGDLANPVDDAVGSDSALSYGSTDSDVTSNVDYLPGVSSVTANSGSRIGGEGDWFLRATSTGTSLCRVGISDLFQVKEGEVIRYNFWLRSNSNHTPREIRLGGINGLALAGSSVIAGTFTFDEWVNFSGYYTPTSDITGLYIRIDNVPGDATFDIDDWSVDVLAATLALISESIQPERGQWLDVSANRLPALQAATGTSVINPRSGQKTFAQRTATNGSVWAGGADRMILPDHHTLDAIYVRSAAGGETVQVGSTAGGANIVASVTLVAGLNRLVMVAAASSTAKVSLTSDSTNALEWDIRYTKAAFFA